MEPLESSLGARWSLRTGPQTSQGQAALGWARAATDVLVDQWLHACRNGDYKSIQIEIATYGLCFHLKSGITPYGPSFNLKLGIAAESSYKQVGAIEVASNSTWKSDHGVEILNLMLKEYIIAGITISESSMSYTCYHNLLH